jgi:hypothetical protein
LAAVNAGFTLVFLPPMKLNSIFSKLTSNSNEKKENFLALEISSDTVKSASWSVQQGKVKVLRLGSIQEWEKEEDLLKATDLAITSASEGISPEPEKVILGLPHDWVGVDSILPKKKALLAKLSKNLNLEPIGFVVSIEALVSYLKVQQGTPPSAIFVRLGETEIVVSLVNLGKIMGIENVGRSQDLALDIKEGLARFKGVESLPSRIILFDGLSDFEEAKQQIISFDWLANLPFLHFPKVESLERDFVMKAIAIAGGGEVAKSLGFSIESKEEIAAEAPKKEPEEVEPVQKEEKVEERVEEQDTEQEAVLAGFVEGKDIKEIKRQLKTTQEKEAKEVEVENEKESFLKLEKKNFFSFFSNFLAHINLFSFFNFSSKKGLFLGLFFLILMILALSSWFLLGAKVTIYFKPETIEKELTLTMDTKASNVDEEKEIIPAQELTTEVKGEDQAEVTGEKLIGDKAKGQVVIYNKIDLAKTFPSGTVLVGENNLKYILDEEVTVASRSMETSTEGEQISWGKAAAEISAAQVGEESNTKSGATFTFKDYPESNFSARSDEGLTGGSSKKVKVVTTSDRDKLLEKLIKDLEEKGKQELQNKLSADKAILDKVFASKVIKKDYDKKVDEEAQKVKLTLDLSVSSLAFAKQDLQLILEKQLSSDIHPGLALKDNFTTEILKVEPNDDKTKAAVNLKVQAILLPSVDQEKLKNTLKGKSLQSAKDNLLSLTNLSRAKIDIFPSILGKLQLLPFRAENIKIEVVSE